MMHIDPEEELRNLLAIIHRDGGHYTYEHGLKKSIHDAILLWAKMKIDLDNLKLENGNTVGG